MKKMCAVWISVVILLFGSYKTHAQALPGTQQQVIPSVPLSVTFSKTTNLLFPYAIKSVDKGSNDLLVRIAGGVENILQVKAAKQGFPETNLTVVTGDGKLFSYTVTYSDDPVQLNIKVENPVRTINADALFAATGDNQAKINDLSEQIALKKPLNRRIKDKHSDVTLALSGIYIRDEALYVQLSLENSSQINYDISQFRFYIKDKSQAKRTASQEQEIRPLKFTGNTEIIRGNSRQTVVVVLPKFTIPDKKYLAVQLMEKNGGRNLLLKIKNKTLVKAAVL